MRRYLIIMAVIVFVLQSDLANAQSYEPGSVILLPKKKSGELKTPQQRLEQQKKENTASVSGQNRGQFQSPVTLNSNRSGSDSQEEKLSRAYAAHMYMSVCSDEYRAFLAPKSEPNLNQALLWADIHKSCQCLSDQILAHVSPADLSDFVMYNYGKQDYASADPEASAYFISDQNEEVGNWVGNEDFRTKCGFLK